MVSISEINTLSVISHRQHITIMTILPMMLQLQLMRDAELMHTSMDGCNRFVERSFKIRLVIRFTVMVSDITRYIVQSRVADKRQATFDQGQHITGSAFVEHPPALAKRDVNRGCMGEAAALPDIVMLQRAKSRPAAASGKPGISVNLHRRFQLHVSGPVYSFFFGDNLSMLHEL